jgi:UDP-N-acetylmuramate--alanine ligase
LKNSGKDPTILVGGNLSEIGGNVSVGNSDYFITEACEYMDSFLNLAPRYAIILNIDSDHLDYFKDIDHIVRSFESFAGQVADDGVVIAFDANPFVSGIIRDTEHRVITYGFHAGCTYCAHDIKFSPEGLPAFTIEHNGEDLCRIQLAVPGDHNVTNALAAFSCCHDIGVPSEEIKGTLEAFTGTQRRFELLGETTNGVRIVDDYAHHPNEINATINAARKMPGGDLWIIFQPHTYTRTMALHDDFAEALAAADKVVMAEIYAAREKNIHQISSSTIVDKMKESDPSKAAWFLDTFEEITEFVLKYAKPGDLIITMGAGDINNVGEMILEADRLAFMN